MEKESVLFYQVPEGKKFGKLAGKFLLPLLMLDSNAVSLLMKPSRCEEAIKEMIKVGNLKGHTKCPICHHNQVTHFILPDLQSSSPCYRQACCQRCQDALAKQFDVPISRVLPISLETLLSLTDPDSRRVVAKYFRDLCSLPKDHGESFIVRFQNSLN